MHRTPTCQRRNATATQNSSAIRASAGQRRLLMLRDEDLGAAIVIVQNAQLICSTRLSYPHTSLCL